MNMSRVAPITYFLLRVVSGFLFWQAGSVILFGWFGGMPGGAKLQIVSQTGIGGILEFVGGIAMILGLFTRPVAFIISGEMAVAYFQFHQPHGTWPLQNNGLPAVLLCFIFLFFAAHGGGPWSLDTLIHRKRGEAAL